MINSNDIIFNEIPGKGGNLGQIILNRPAALNALSQAMIQQMSAQLTIWLSEDHIKAVIIRGAGDRAFCAGGDIRQLYEIGKTNPTEALTFFYDEYRLNYQIKYFAKPYISFLDGITMGGGAGVSVHGSHRIASERFLFAMPETGIGFFTDIGASYFLSNCPGSTGIYCGLTGARIKAADAHFMGIINYIIPHAKLDDVVNTLAETEFIHTTNQQVSEVLRRFTVSPEHSPLTDHYDEIDNYFAVNTVEEILTLLYKNNSPWCQETAKILLTKSPTSLKVILEQLHRGAHLDFAACMQMEYGLVQHFLRSHDLYEGIRAVLVDKDQKPQWEPANLTDVNKDTVLSYFEPVSPPLPLENTK